MENLQIKNNGTDAKLWIIGDSFAGLVGWERSWQHNLYNCFIGNHMYVSSKGSRDIQTIFDIFLKNLHRIKPNDFVILFLPTLSRFRLPLEVPQIDCEWSDNRNKEEESLESISNSMLGNSAYTSNVKDLNEFLTKSNDFKNQYLLEWPLNHMDPTIFQPNPPDEEPNYANITQIINASKAFADNWNGIFKSIKSYVQFELMYCSWANELDSKIVNTRSVITNDCGMWYTLHDEFKKTNGEFGKKNDVHWSNIMNDTFYKSIIKNYPQYFKDEYKEF